MQGRKLLRTPRHREMTVTLGLSLNVNRGLFSGTALCQGQGSGGAVGPREKEASSLPPPHTHIQRWELWGFQGPGSGLGSES